MTPDNTSHECAKCGKLGRSDAMMLLNKRLYHTGECYEKAQKDHTASDALQAPTISLPVVNPKDVLANLPPEAQAIILQEQQRMLAEAQKRIASLEHDLSLIEAGKEAAERALRTEKAAAFALAKHGMLQLNRDFISIANELAFLTGKKQLTTEGKLDEIKLNPDEPYFETQAELDAYRNQLVIDFMNRYRRGVMADLEKDETELLVVKGNCYDMTAKIIFEILSTRNVKLKITRNVEFAQEQAAAKDQRIVKETKKSEKKAERAQAQSPEEKRIGAIMKLMGVDRDAAVKQITMMDAAVKSKLAEVKK